MKISICGQKIRNLHDLIQNLHEWGTGLECLKIMEIVLARASNNQIEMNVQAIRINNIQEWMGVEVTEFG
ncbi:MAG: hypothetical protein WA667_03135 [Candidatus Nitrosopolaris sp.]